MSYIRFFMPMTCEANGYGFKGRRPAGRSIAEARGNSCKLTVWAQDLRAETFYGVFLLFEDGGRYAGVSMGNLAADEKGKGEMRREFGPEELDRFRLADVAGVAVLAKDTAAVVSPLCGYRAEAVAWRHLFYEYTRAVAVDVVPVSEEEPPMVDMMPVAEEELPAEDVAPNTEIEPIPEDTEPNTEIEPTPEYTEPNAKIEPEPENAEPDTEIKPTPEDTEPNAEIEPTPEDAEPNAEIEPTPEYAEPNAEIEPTPEDTEPNAGIEPTPEDPPPVVARSEATKQSSRSHELTPMPLDCFANARNDEDASARNDEDVSARNDEDISLRDNEDVSLRDNEDKNSRISEDRSTHNNEHENIPHEEHTRFRDNEADPPSTPTHLTPQQNLEATFASKERVTPFKNQSRRTDWVRFNLTDNIPPPINRPRLFEDPFVQTAHDAHGHLIFGITTDKGPRRHIIGVPASLSQDKRQQARRLGFTQFKPSDGTHKKGGGLGYWLMFITV